MTSPAPRRILLDIEGTIAPISFVYDVLFPYARQVLPLFLAAHWDDHEVKAARARIAADTQPADAAPPPEMPRPALVDHLLALMDRDAKTTGLKQLQGLIWREGYLAGNLRSVLFPDVAPALARWHDAGIDTRIYSSGSIEAQKLFLAYTESGDLSPYIRGYYDTTTGPKQSPESYRKIAEDWGVAPASILFMSDVPAELDAAAAAGLQMRLAVRPGNRPVDTCSYFVVTSLDEIDLPG